MPKVKKGNRVLSVSEAGIPFYLKLGYDQIDDKGKVEKKATGGRTVSLAEHNKVLEELEALKKSPANTDALEKEIKALKVENEKLAAENEKLIHEKKGQQETKKDGK